MHSCLLQVTETTWVKHSNFQTFACISSSRELCCELQHQPLNFHLIRNWVENQTFVLAAPFAFTCVHETLDALQRFSHWLFSMCFFGESTSVTTVNTTALIWVAAPATMASTSFLDSAAFQYGIEDVWIVFKKYLIRNLLSKLLYVEELYLSWVWMP